jgi:hypothetical protein
MIAIGRGERTLKTPAMIQHADKCISKQHVQRARPHEWRSGVRLCDGGQAQHAGEQQKPRCKD